MNNNRLKLAKNLANAKQQTPEVESLLFENYSRSSSILSPKKIGYIPKNK